MELGEPVGVGLFVSDDETHSENTCPWHKKKTASAKKMDPSDGDEDAHGPMGDNSGKKLGTNLTNDEKPAPDDHKVLVDYEQASVLKYPGGKKKKIFQVYNQTVDEEEYNLQYAPHHLVPGNESLKGSSIVAFLGDDDVIENFKAKGKPSSHLKKDESVGYDVNSAANGEWLPSPYALSMGNEWPAAEGFKALRRREDDDLNAELDETEAFKLAYAVFAMRKARKQFHMRHADYSSKVREILDAMANKIKLLAQKCPVAKDSKSDKKCNAPAGLGARIDSLSGKLRGLLRGNPTGWRNPLFTDDLSKQYLENYKGKKKRTPKLNVM